MPTHGSASGGTALVLGGGGARGAYQAGVLRGIASRRPDLRLPILTGISAGAINVAFLAAHEGALDSAADALANVWLGLSPDQVYAVDALSLARNVARWGWKLVSGGLVESPQARGMVNTEPLAHLLRARLTGAAGDCIRGIERNVARAKHDAVALTATSYATGHSVTWVQGRGVTLWNRPERRAEIARLGVQHVMASAALPLFFPAQRVGDEWFGDGGIRLTAPLSPALHLGADRILTISTRAPRGGEAPQGPRAYPPPAQILGVLYNAVFLDVIDQDVLRLEMVNELVRHVPARDAGGLREVDVMVIRPSRNLGEMSRAYEPRLPAALRFLTRGWGTRRTPTPDVLSLMMFQPGYLRALVELGEQDARTQAERIDRFLDGSTPSPERRSRVAVAASSGP